MRRYVSRRLMIAVFVVMLSVAINFFIIRLAPGNPVKLLAGTDNPNPDMIAALEAKYGFDKPLWEQFLMFIQNLLKGDLGFSYVSNQPVTEIISERVVPTLMITITALLCSVTIGISLGIICGKKPGSIIDRIISSFSYLFDATPSFWLGMIMILIFASTLKIFPTSGMVNLRNNAKGFAYFTDVLHHMFLPLLTLVLIQFPYYFRITRSSIIQTLNEDFITTLRATGMSENKIFNKYVLRNAIIPTVTVVGMSIAFLLSGSAMIETIFAWPGMGRLLLSSISSRDYQVLTGIYLIISISVAVVMIIVDIIYSLIDPRIKYN